LRGIRFCNITIGEVKNAISFDDTDDVILKDCHFGGKAGIPTQANEKDQIFKWSCPNNQIWPSLRITE
jgi:hypothetical protein